MVEELKIIMEIFKGASETALHAFIAYGAYKLVYLSVIVVPIYKFATFFVDRAFVKEGKNESA